MNTTIKIMCAIAFGLSMIEPSLATTGGSWYPSQLSSIGAGNVSYGRTSDWTSTGYSVNASPTAAIDLQAGVYGNSMASVYTSVNQPSFMEWDLPSGTFSAQTVIAYRNTGYPFDSNGPWHLEMFDGSVWNPIGVGGIGAPNDTSIAMGNTGITGTKIRAIYDPPATVAGLYFMSMGEIVVLPDHLQLVTNSYTASASSFFSGGYEPSRGIDNQLGSSQSWFSAPGDSNAWYTLSFTSPARIDALLLSKWDQVSGTGYTNAIVDIYVNGTLAGGWTNGTQTAGDVEMFSANSYGNFNAFKFNSPLLGVNDLTLKFVGNGRASDGGQGLGEIIPLTIPEPNAMLLVWLGGMLLVSRRR